MVKDYRKEAKNSALVSGGIGALALVGSIVATVVSYVNADIGGTYTLWWGPALFGVVFIGISVWQLATLDAQAKKREAEDNKATKDSNEPTKNV